MKLYTIILDGQIIGCEDNLAAAEAAVPAGADLRTVYVDNEHQVLAETRRLGWTWAQD
jgi:hypothetical protein